MNNEEAIAILKRATLFEPKLENKDYPEAFELAIKALEKIDKLESVNELFCEDYTIEVRKILFGGE